MGKERILDAMLEAEQALAQFEDIVLYEMARSKIYTTKHNNLGEISIRLHVNFAHIERLLLEAYEE